MNSGGVQNGGSIGKQEAIAGALQSFWETQTDKIKQTDLKTFRDPQHCPELPLARIKKIMKLDDDVKGQMISAEAPVLFSKAAEIFLEELTLRAWFHTDDNKRKTLQKNDVAMAVAKYDQFDFLIDIVPREEIKKKVDGDNHNDVRNGNDFNDSVQTVPLSADQLQQLLSQIGSTTSVVSNQNGQQFIQLPAQIESNEIIRNQSPITTTTTTDQCDQLPQVFQQVVAEDGTVQHIPLQLSAEQLQILKSQFTTQQQQQVVSSCVPKRPVSSTTTTSVASRTSTTLADSVMN